MPPRSGVCATASASSPAAATPLPTTLPTAAQAPGATPPPTEPPTRSPSASRRSDVAGGSFHASAEEDDVGRGAAVSDFELDDGPVYAWHDGDRTLTARLQGSLVAEQQDGAGGAHSEIVPRSEESPGAESYPVFRSQSGALMTLPGGLLLLLDPEWDQARVDRFFADNSIAAARPGCEGERHRSGQPRGARLSRLLPGLQRAGGDESRADHRRGRGDTCGDGHARTATDDRGDAPQPAGRTLRAAARVAGRRRLLLRGERAAGRRQRSGVAARHPQRPQPARRHSAASRAHPCRALRTRTDGPETGDAAWTGLPPRPPRSAPATPDANHSAPTADRLPFRPSTHAAPCDSLC